MATVAGNRHRRAREQWIDLDLAFGAEHGNALADGAAWSGAGGR